MEVTNDDGAPWVLVTYITHQLQHITSKSCTQLSEFIYNVAKSVLLGGFENQAHRYLAQHSQGFDTILYGTVISNLVPLPR